MTPENYLQQYCAPLRALPEVKIAEKLQPFTSLDADHYYPPHAGRELSIDALQRSTLLQLLQDILCIAYPQQRLSQPLASGFPKILQELMEERERHNHEIEILRKQLAQTQVEMCNYRDQANILNTEINKLYHSNSWRCTTPLRWLGRVVNAMRSADIRITFD